MLWDQGTWTPEVDDVDAALKKGDLKFTLDGYKLKGSWVLVRTGGRYGSRRRRSRSWLLIKHRDDWAGDVDITEFAPRSVKSDGDFEDILAADNPDVWVSNRPAEGRRGRRDAREDHRARGGAESGGTDAGSTAPKAAAQKRTTGAKTHGSAKTATRKKKARPRSGAQDQRQAGSHRQLKLKARRMNKSDFILFSGGAPGAEAEFGACAERHGIEEVNFTFDGHTEARRRGIRVLNHEELQAGDVSLEYVSRLMHRRYTDSPTIRKILQTLWYQVNNGQEIYVVGVDPGRRHRARRHGLGRRVREAVQQAAVRVRSGEGRLVRLDRRRLDSRCAETPVITHPHFTGTGTRHIHDNGKRAIEDLFTKSFESTAVRATAPQADQE